MPKKPIRAAGGKQAGEGAHDTGTDRAAGGKQAGEGAHDTWTDRAAGGKQAGEGAHHHLDTWTNVLVDVGA